jgi:hypothetical protein
VFNPLTELETEIDYAFTPVLLETVFRRNLIDSQHRGSLQNFKRKVDNIPSELWDWQFIDNHPIWKQIRVDANSMLNLLNISNREYIDESITYLGQ